MTTSRVVDDLCRLTGDTMLAVEQIPSDGTHPIGDAWVDHYWVPILGPSAVFLARRLADRAAVGGTIRDFGLAVGLPAGLDKPLTPATPIVRTLWRLHTFGWVVLRPQAEWVGVRVECRDPHVRAVGERLPSWLPSLAAARASA